MNQPHPEVASPSGSCSRGRGRAWLAWSMPAIFFLYEFLIRVSPGVIIGDLETRFRTDSADMGFDMSLYYYAYAPMQLVVGLLLDRFGGKIPLAIAAVICGAGCLVFAVAGGVTGLGAARFLMGFGSAFAYVGTVFVASIWFPRDRLALLSGLTAALGMLGAISAEALLGRVLAVMTWREAFDLFAAFALILAVLMWFMVPRNPRWHVQQVERDRLVHGGGVLSSLMIVIRSRQTWLLAIVTGLLYLPVGTFAALWGNDYLQTVMGFAAGESGIAVALIFVGIAVSGPVLGWYSDRRGRRARYLKVGTVVAFAASVGVLVIPEPPRLMVFPLLMLIGVGGGSIVLAFPLAMEHSPAHCRGSAMTFVNFIQMIMTGIGQWVVGILLSSMDEGTSGPSSAHAFRVAFLILPGSLLVGILLAQVLRDPDSAGEPPSAASGLPLGD